MCLAGTRKVTGPLTVHKKRVKLSEHMPPIHKKRVERAENVPLSAVMECVSPAEKSVGMMMVAEGEETRTFIVGIDPGLAHLGLFWYDILQHKALFEIMDMMPRESCPGPKRRALYGERLEQLATHCRPLLSRTFLMFIEIQDHPHRNPDVSLMASMWEQTIRCLCPHIQLFWVHSQDVRTHFDTKGKTYAERKSNSFSSPLALKAFGTRKNAMNTFRLPSLSPPSSAKKAVKNTKKRPSTASHPDAIEAGNVCLFGYHEWKHHGRNVSSKLVSSGGSGEQIKVLRSVPVFL